MRGPPCRSKSPGPFYQSGKCNRIGALWTWNLFLARSSWWIALHVLEENAIMWAAKVAVAGKSFQSHLLHLIGELKLEALLVGHHPVDDGDDKRRFLRIAMIDDRNNEITKSLEGVL